MFIFENLLSEKQIKYDIEKSYVNWEVQKTTNEWEKKSYVETTQWITSSVWQNKMTVMKSRWVRYDLFKYNKRDDYLL